MQILILGGTGFIGGQLARTFAAAGHRVSVLARGQTPAALPAGVERLTGDRDAPGGLRALDGPQWDVCVDLSGYLPQQVQASGERLSGVGRYVFVSAAAAYGDPQGPVTETDLTPRLTPAEQDAVQRVEHLDDRTYGPSKVACEDRLRDLFGDRLTVLRPQVVTGPGDPTPRYVPWLVRAAQAGPLLVPGDGSDHLQVIDVRDVAAFTVRVLEADLGGVYNLAGPRLTWAEFVRVLGAERPVWVGLETLAAHGIPLSRFPLYRPAGGVRSGLMYVSSARAQAAGLTLTAPEVTAQDTRAALGEALNHAPAPDPDLQRLLALLA
ncbi:NAD-dependent epimerase/dehydratase family protein [Deinococcus sonorensis]|uniref:NAD-dependent epimerase/dehydratase family protein n=2 Tax=Deinococcus sonorensis TaxID=309891 RepID=A0AAU7U7Y5_9DEIO